MTTDRGRAEVYAAETAAFDGTDLERVRPVAEIVAMIDTFTAGEWWPGPRVRAVAMRADASSSCAREVADVVEIRIAAPQATWATAAHELAHALAGVSAGHGSTYRRAMLDVVDEATNTVITPRRADLHVIQLREAYAAAGLPVGSRRWPAPTSGRPFAL